MVYIKKLFIIFALVVATNSLANCKITKNTYEVTDENKTCYYTLFWRAGYIGKTYKAQSYNVWISPECKSFPKPLKGKKIKKELIREIIDSDCPFESVSKKTR